MAMIEDTPAMAPASVPVAAHALTRRYGEGATEVQALRGVDVEVRAGELVAVMGPSGSGKAKLMHLLAGLDQPTAGTDTTSVMTLIAGLEKPTSGTVTIAGTELSALDDGDLTRLRREHIGFI